MKARLAELPPAGARAEAAGGGERAARGDGRDRDPRPVSRSQGHPRVPVPVGRFARYEDPDEVFRAVVPREWRADRAPDGSVAFAADEARLGSAYIVALLVRPLALRIGTRKGAFDQAMDRLIDDLLAESSYLKERRGTRRATTLDGEDALESTLEGRARGRDHDYDEVVVVTLRPLGRRGAVAVLRVFPADDERAFAAVFDEMIDGLRFR